MVYQLQEKDHCRVKPVDDLGSDHPYLLSRFYDPNPGVFHGGWVKEGDAVDEKEKVL